MACERLVNTFFLDIRQAPKARKMVRTTGISSGKIAIARVIPAKNPLIQSNLVKPYTTITTAQRPSPANAKLRTSVRVSLCRDVSSSSRDSNLLPILPISVFKPVHCTWAIPWPCSTSVPE